MIDELEMQLFFRTSDGKEVDFILERPDRSVLAIEVKKAESVTPSPEKKEEVQGVFVVLPSKKVEFRQVETGILGSTDVEIKNGLREHDEIVTGSYKVLRTIRNGAAVKVDNSVATKEES